MIVFRLFSNRGVPQWVVALGLIALVAVVGVVGYMTVVPGMGFVHALYMTVITISTVGFSDLALRDTVDPALETRVCLFTIALILVGVGSVAFAFSVFVRALVEGELRDLIGLRRTRRRLFFMKDHYIVCGFGRIGEIIAETLAHERIPVVVIEQDATRRREIEARGAMCLIGDATNDSMLHQASIDKARGLIAVTDSDPENLFITLSARQINPGLQIVSRALSEDAEMKLIRAGANRVVLPYKIGAHQLAQAALRPNVVDFIDIATRTTKLDIEIEEMRLAEGSSLAGKQLQEAPVLRELGLIVIGIRHGNQKQVQFKPSASTLMQSNDTLILLGESESLRKLRSHMS